MMEYLNNSPYGRLHYYSDLNDLVEHFKRRIAVEDMVMAELLRDHCIRLESKNFDFDNLLMLLEDKYCK